MGIKLASTFDRQSQQPLDGSLYVFDDTARDAIVAGIRYEGMTVFVTSTNSNYQLRGGIANINWTDTNASTSGVTITAVQSIAAAGTIAIGGEFVQVLKVQGDAAPVSASLTPFTTIPADGMIIHLLGRDAVNTLKISYNDADEGCMLKGDCYLGLNDMLTLVYDLTSKRYWEISRN